MRQAGASVDRATIRSDFPARRRSDGPARRSRRRRRPCGLSDRCGWSINNPRSRDRGALGCKFAAAHSCPIGPTPLITEHPRSTVLVAGEQDLREDGGSRGSLWHGIPRFPLLESALLSSRPFAVLARASQMAVVVLLAACAERQSLPNDPTGRLFARGLDEITDLYIAPVSDRRLILAAAARFSRLDDKFSIRESPGAENKTQIILNYA